MANKRMFSNDVVGTDRFLAMSSRAQLLYFHLGMRADDDGFVSSSKIAMMAAKATAKDLRCLIENDFLKEIEPGVVLILDWRISNELRRDRYHMSRYLKDGRLLITISSSGRYRCDWATGMMPPDDILAAVGCQTVANPLPEVRLD